MHDHSTTVGGEWPEDQVFSSAKVQSDQFGIKKSRWSVPAQLTLTLLTNRQVIREDTEILCDFVQEDMGLLREDKESRYPTGESIDIGSQRSSSCSPEFWFQRTEVSHFWEFTFYDHTKSRWWITPLWMITSNPPVRFLHKWVKMWHAFNQFW